MTQSHDGGAAVKPKVYEETGLLSTMDLDLSTSKDVAETANGSDQGKQPGVQLASGNLQANPVFLSSLQLGASSLFNLFPDKYHACGKFKSICATY